MAGSRWAETAEDAEYEAKRKLEKEEKKRRKDAKAKEAEEQRKLQEQATAAAKASETTAEEPSSKRRKIEELDQPPSRIVRHEPPTWSKSGSIDEYETLNSIEEGSYGWVSRAKSRVTNQVVALKKLKMDGSEHSGFPVTGLREIQCLFACRHENIVHLQRVVCGPALDQVYMVMEFVEHDLKTLMQEMHEPFLASETKTLLLQLVGALSYLHDNWIIHRDLKTSNILMDNRGTLKIADFGMARQFSDPPPAALTTLVVTLWYRAPELLLGAITYDFAVDIWSLGCIFGELLTNEPLLSGKNEVDQLFKTFELCGVPNEESWPGFRRLPNARSLRLPKDKRSEGNVIRAKFPTLTRAGAHLLQDLLELNPTQRPTASEILQHPYFRDDPRPKHKSMFPTFPSKAGGERRRRAASPSAPKRGDAPAINGSDADFSSLFNARQDEQKGAGFQLKVA